MADPQEAHMEEMEDLDNNDYEDGPNDLFHMNPRPEPPSSVVVDDLQQPICAIVGALARQQDLDWEDANGQEDYDDNLSQEEEPTYVEPRTDTTRVLRSATIAASVSLSCDMPAAIPETPPPPAAANALECSKVNLNDAVDEEHRQLLDAYNESVENLSRLRSYLAKHPEQDCQSVYVHLCEEAVILQNHAELRYLRTCDAYQAINLSSGLRHSYVHKPVPPAAVKSHQAKVIKGKTVVKGKDGSGKWPMNEQVGEWILAALKEEKDQRFPEDAKFPLLGDGDLLPGQSTLSEFLRDLEGTCALSNIPHNGKLAILDWLHRHVPELRTGTRVSKAGNNVHDFYKYLMTDWRHVLVDACPNNCMLYVGEHRWDIKCPCGEYRFSKCGNNGKCTQGGVDCNPYETPTHNQRSSFQVVMYRYYFIVVFIMINKLQFLTQAYSH